MTGSDLGENVAVASGMGGALSFQEEFTLPTLREAVEALDALGIREYDRGDRRFAPPPEFLERPRPMADMFGITPLVALMIFIGGTFSEWAMSRIYDAAWESAKGAFRSLLSRRAGDPPTLDRPLTIDFEFWFERERATAGVRVEIPAGDDGLAALEWIPKILAEIGDRAGVDANSDNVVIVRTRDE